MKSLFQAELYRARKSKSPLIILIVCFGMSLFSGLSYGIMYGNAPWIQKMYENAFGYNPFAFGDDLDLGLDIAGFTRMKSVGEFISTGLRINICLYLVIFIAVFLMPMRRSGFIKNLSSEHSRTRIFFVHVLLILIYSFLLVDVAALAMALMCLVTYRGLPLGGLPELLTYLVTSALLVAAIGLVVLTLTDLLRRQTPAIVMSVIYLWMIAPTVFAMGQVMTLYTSRSDFRLQYVSLAGNLMLLSPGKWDTILSALLVIAVYAGLCILLHFLVVRKKDII